MSTVRCPGRDMGWPESLLAGSTKKQAIVGGLGDADIPFRWAPKPTVNTDSFLTDCQPVGSHGVLPDPCVLEKFRKGKRNHTMQPTL